MNRIILSLLLIAPALCAQVMDTVPSQSVKSPVDFGYIIRGKIVDGINRKEAMHFIDLEQDKFWIWETDNYYIKINLPKVLERTPGYSSTPWSELEISLSLDSTNHKIDVPFTLEDVKRSSDQIGKKQYIYLHFDGASLKRKYKNMISSDKYWSLKLDISLKNHETQTFLKKVEADWSIQD